MARGRQGQPHLRPRAVGHLEGCVLTRAKVAWGAGSTLGPNDLGAWSVWLVVCGAQVTGQLSLPHPSTLALSRCAASAASGCRVAERSETRLDLYKVRGS